MAKFFRFAAGENRSTFLNLDHVVRVDQYLDRPYTGQDAGGGSTRGEPSIPTLRVHVSTGPGRSATGAVEHIQITDKSEIDELVQLLLRRD